MRVLSGVLVALVLVIMLAMFLPTVSIQAAPVSGDQILLSMKFLKAGVQTQGAGVLQVGQVSTLSAAVAGAMTKVVSAPSSGGVYIRAVLVEKSAGATGAITISTGTGTNCGTGTAVLLGPITNPQIGRVDLGVVATAAKDVCLTTEGATTIARLLSN